MKKFLHLFRLICYVLEILKKALDVLEKDPDRFRDVMDAGDQNLKRRKGERWYEPPSTPGQKTS